LWIVHVVLQLKSDAKEPFEKLDSSAVVKNVRICTLCINTKVAF